MPRPALLVLLLFLLLTMTATVAVVVGRQQHPSAWSALLRLDECELPCWIGIVPRSTTMREAQELVKDAYGDDSLYLLEQQEHFYYIATYKPTGHRIGIHLSPEGEKEAPQSVVRIIWLMPRLRFYPSSPGELPIMAELYSDLGDAVDARLSTGVEAPSVAVYFGDERVNVYVDQLQCEKILLNQEIRQIVIRDAMPLNRYAWLSKPEIWRGYGQCHDLEVLLFP